MRKPVKRYYRALRSSWSTGPAYFAFLVFVFSGIVLVSGLFVLRGVITSNLSEAMGGTFWTLTGIGFCVYFLLVRPVKEWHFYRNRTEEDLLNEIGRAAMRLLKSKNQRGKYEVRDLIRLIGIWYHTTLEIKRVNSLLSSVVLGSEGDSTLWIVYCPPDKDIDQARIELWRRGEDSSLDRGMLERLFVL